MLCVIYDLQGGFVYLYLRNGHICEPFTIYVCINKKSTLVGNPRPDAQREGEGRVARGTYAQMGKMIEAMRR